MLLRRPPRQPTMPYEAGGGFVFLPPGTATAPYGGLLDPMVLSELPQRGGLLDPAGWNDIRIGEGRRPARRVRQRDLPEILRDVPLGPEGGLIGAMLAGYVDPEDDLHGPVVAADNSGALGGWTSSPFGDISEAERPESPQSAARQIGSSTVSAESERKKGLRTIATEPLPVDVKYHPRNQMPDHRPSMDRLETPIASANIEPRPDGSMWKIQGPVRTMVRPPDSALAHYQTQPHQPPRTAKPSQNELRAIRRKFQSSVATGKASGLDFAASNLEHFLEGSGAPRFYDPDWLRSFPAVKGAERRVRHYFEEWLTGERKPGPAKELV